MTSGNWNEQIQSELEDSDIVIFMLSLSFINSNYILNEEVFKTFEALKSNPDKKIICVLVKNFPWQSFERLKVLTDLNDDEFKDLKEANTMVELTTKQFIPYFIENKGKDNENRYLLPLNKWEYEEDAMSEIIKNIIENLN